MTVTLHAQAEAAGDTRSVRFRLHRAGILNVWQYDDQEFLLAEGRLLLRGANGAGKSKTLEMLLPFALDGDKARLTASGRHHTSLLWLMTDGYDGQARIGYVWVEFLRPLPDGTSEAFTCGVGIRASVSGRTATAWYFTTPRRVGHDLFLEDAGGPLSRPRLEESLGAAGQVFDKAGAYKEHVGRSLFGLSLPQYDEVLRLLYWLRQPQVGEDIEPSRLSTQLAQSLPQLDEQAVKAAGDTFDELSAFGEQIERRTAAAGALGDLAAAYARYARATVAARARALLDTVKEERRLRTSWRRRDSELRELTEQREAADDALSDARHGQESAQRGIAELEASPEARDQRRLTELAERAEAESRMAGSASQRAARSREDERRRRVLLREYADSVLTGTRAHTTVLRELDTRLRDDVGADAPARARLRPAALDDPRLDDPPDAGRLAGALAETLDGLAAGEAAVGTRQAAAQVVREALDRLAEARRGAEIAEQRASDAEERWERARDHRADAEAVQARVADELLGSLREWAGDEAAVEVVIPGELSPETVDDLAPQVRAATDPALADLRDRAQTAASAGDRARAEEAELAERRAAIEAERDPAPPAPNLPRTPRSDGAALWLLVDFADHVADDDRASVEAALQASGLLDAWVRPDGALLDAGVHDVVLPAGAAHDGATLADVLVPAVPTEVGVSADVVRQVLRRIRFGASVEAADAPAVAADGSWALAPLHGRAAKERAQYVGATARAHERRRRLDEIDRALEAARAALAAAEHDLRGLTARIEALEAWLRRLPDVASLRLAWARTEERRHAERAAESANAQAQRAAHDARETVVRRREEVAAVAGPAGLPDERRALAAVEERLRRLSGDFSGAARAVPPLRRDLDRWIADHAELAEATGRAETDRAEADQLRADAAATAAALDELRATVGATVRELEARVATLRDEVTTRRAAAERLDSELRGLHEEIGSATAALDQASRDLEEHRGHRAEVLAGLAATAAVPGLLESAATDGDIDPAVLAAASDVPSGDDVPSTLVDAAKTLAVAGPAEAGDVNVVWRAYNEAGSGPAADHEPRVAEHGDLLAVTGRGESGELPIGRLAAQVASAVAADRELLTLRERGRFEQHILGELGDAIRRCRVEAVELVDAMNRLLAGVTTSQGIRMKLDWRLRDDVPSESRRAVELLGQPVGALLPEERVELRDALHRLIDASRAERPELGYGEHLAAALDYREWFAFRIRYTRPESQGGWLDLHRRSPLSQGEQKVLCYLPLFAAAAAHFTSLAGAAPHAPRLVLLDDAFPKIDVRTHPLLFGLLVDLDLDFVITSERLWGDHDTVPSLAIYEALRDPAQRGIAQYEYRWDGRQLRSLG